MKFFESTSFGTRTTAYLGPETEIYFNVQLKTNRRSKTVDYLEPLDCDVLILDRRYNRALIMENKALLDPNKKNRKTGEPYIAHKLKLIHQYTTLLQSRHSNQVEFEIEGSCNPNDPKKTPEVFKRVLTYNNHEQEAHRMLCDWFQNGVDVSIRQGTPGNIYNGQQIKKQIDQWRKSNRTGTDRIHNVRWHPGSGGSAIEHTSRKKLSTNPNARGNVYETQAKLKQAFLEDRLALAPNTLDKHPNIPTVLVPWRSITPLLPKNQQHAFINTMLKGGSKVKKHFKDGPFTLPAQLELLKVKYPANTDPQMLVKGGPLKVMMTDLYDKNGRYKRKPRQIRHAVKRVETLMSHLIEKSFELGLRSHPHFMVDWLRQVSQLANKIEQKKQLQLITRDVRDVYKRSNARLEIEQCIKSIGP